VRAASPVGARDRVGRHASAAVGSSIPGSGLPDANEVKFLSSMLSPSPKWPWNKGRNLTAGHDAGQISADQEADGAQHVARSGVINKSLFTWITMART